MVDPIWRKFPIWIEESGLPGELAQQHGPQAWLVFRQVIEEECAQNLTPDWFQVSLETLAQRTGLEEDAVQETIHRLVNAALLESSDAGGGVFRFRIATPLKPPIPLETIRQKLAQELGVGGFYVFRYADTMEGMDKATAVVYLYQMVFGVRFTPRIAEDLEEMANTYDFALIYQTFSEASRKAGRSLSWIRRHLKRQAQESEMPSPIDAE